MAKNYPRYPVDAYRIEFIITLPAVVDGGRENIIIDIVRENPFGTAFEK